MSNLAGYHNRYIRVNVESGTSDSVKITEEVLRHYIGGVGLGTWILLQENAAEVHPLSPESPLAFVFSPLVGSPLTTSAKFAVVCKSPLTERINDSLASSHFALAGKRLGADAIVIQGRAREPSILVLDNGHAELLPAKAVWGTSPSTAEELIRAELGADFQLAVVGPAGEQQIRYATISHSGRHAGRGGAGAVLGAKNIKAIAVRGSQRTHWANSLELVQLAKRLSKRSFGPATAKYRELGTLANLLTFNRLKTLPTANFRRGSFAGVHELSPEQLSISRQKARDSCAACTIGCEHLYQMSGSKSDGKGVRVEYENMFALGPLCEVGDPDIVLQASRKCDDLGIDTISAGGTIAFAMECVERGLLDAPWLRFGDGKALLQALDEIGKGIGIGPLLALGCRELAVQIGHNSISFAPQVKGLEIPGYEPRAMQTMALGFAVGTRGADHNRSGAYEVDFSERVNRRNIATDAVKFAVETEDKAALMDSMILCKFLRGVFADYYAEAAEMLELVTGWDVTAQELRRTAKRIVNAKKRFNIQAGWTPEEDTLPERMLREPLSDDPAATLSRNKLQLLIREYNIQRGWTEEGWLEKSAGIGDCLDVNLEDPR